MTRLQSHRVRVVFFLVGLVSVFAFQNCGMEGFRGTQFSDIFSSREGQPLSEGAKVAMAQLQVVEERKQDPENSDFMQAFLQMHQYNLSRIFANEAQLGSCEALLEANSLMVTGAYTVVENESLQTYHCVIEAGKVVAKDVITVQDTPSCIRRGTCLEPASSLEVASFSSSTTGTSGDDVLHGEDGDDYLHGGLGDDQVYGGSGQDQISGGDGNDELHGEAGHDILHGGAGNDSIAGNAGDDYISGGDGNDRIEGGDGDDYLLGNNGIDTLFGNNGNDYIKGGESSDLITGGAGIDTIEGGPGNDLVYSGPDKDYVSGGPGRDRIYGGQGDDVISGNLGQDTLYGEAGNDYLSGNEGPDFLDGGPGDDYLAGHDGDDLLHGGGGNDLLQGHGGADTYIFNPGFGKDAILEFDSNIDKIDVRALGVESLAHLRQMTQCYGRWTGFKATSDDFCVLSFTNADQLAILESPGISDVFRKPEQFARVFIWEISDGESTQREFLKQVYQKYFGRDPNFEGYNHWLEQLQQLDPTQVERDIISGAVHHDRNFLLENAAWVARAFLTKNNFQIPTWLQLDREESEIYINEIYLEYFGRPAAQLGLNHWVDQLIVNAPIPVKASIIMSAGPEDQQRTLATTAHLARQFLRQHQYEIPNWLQINNTQAEIWLNTIYQTYFERDINASGLEYWVSHMEVRSRVQIEMDIINGATGSDRAKVVGYHGEAARSFLTSNGGNIPTWLSTSTYSGASSFVQSVFSKYFARPANTDGLRYWIGQSVLYSRVQLEKNIITAAQASDRSRVSSDPERAVIARQFLVENNFSIPTWLQVDTQQAQVWLNTIYQKYFDRNINTTGLNFWVGAMSTRSAEQIEVDIISGSTGKDRARLVGYNGTAARSFLTTNGRSVPSWLSVATYNSASSFVRLVFNKYFNRPPESNGLRYWIGQSAIRSRTLLEGDIILASQSTDRSDLAGNPSLSDLARKYLSDSNRSIPSWLQPQSAGGYVPTNSPVPPAAPTMPSYDTSSNRSFITRVFLDYFGREPNQSGMNYWLPYLGSKSRDWLEGAIIGGATGSDLESMLDNTSLVAIQFLKSKNKTIPSNLNQAHTIFLAYERFFGRVPGQGGLKYWTDQAETRGINPVQRDIIYNCSPTDRARLTTDPGSLARSYNAKAFLNQRGYSIPSWLQ